MKRTQLRKDKYRNLNFVLSLEGLIYKYYVVQVKLLGFRGDRAGEIVPADSCLPCTQLTQV